MTPARRGNIFEANELFAPGFYGISLSSRHAQGNGRQAFRYLPAVIYVILLDEI